MPGRHRADYETFSFELPRPLKVRIHHRAKNLNMSMNQFIVTILSAAAADESLSAADYAAIAAATLEAERTKKRVSTRIPE